MNTCLITYATCEGRYSPQGLRKLSRSLKQLKDFPYTAADQIVEAAARAPKMSIQGVQPKLSAVLNARQNGFELVDTGGRYILKPQNPQYRHLPENEDLSMRLAEAAGIPVPLHGLIYSKDGSLTYFIKRFDREGKKKIAVEDFAQLMGLNRDTKYDASMEKVAQVIDRYCTFPAVEKIKLFRLTLVNFLVGNEDMHVKNFSLMTRQGKVELTPAYDILNTTIVLSKAKEEIALPIKGKKRKLSADILVDYFGLTRLELNRKIVSSVLETFKNVSSIWNNLIAVSFLPNEVKTEYKRLVDERFERLLKGSFLLSK
ncbi:HipA domain-containing protein [Desulfosarcina ovata]|uniref:Phosphatidylinositol kinase n=1 Tax=Desulfosarcina ovata subsp. ovata TaxID=2752305 RepID=A0A5K8AIY1_9BACT|nr:HipA domain-containing protein [Desulfosarcina ovata]BBO91704.1 phosphatidylinositol kinase [Desulfosarcina ovata subsp. ovata]